MSAVKKQLLLAKLEDLIFLDYEKLLHAGAGRETGSPAMLRSLSHHQICIPLMIEHN